MSKVNLLKMSFFVKAKKPVAKNVVAKNVETPTKQYKCEDCGKGLYAWTVYRGKVRCFDCRPDNWDYWHDKLALAVVEYGTLVHKRDQGFWHRETYEHRGHLYTLEFRSDDTVSAITRGSTSKHARRNKWLYMASPDNKKDKKGRNKNVHAL